MSTPTHSMLRPYAGHQCVGSARLGVAPTDRVSPGRAADPRWDARSSRSRASLRGTKRESDESTPVFLFGDHASRGGTVAVWAFSTKSVRVRRRDALSDAGLEAEAE